MATNSNHAALDWDEQHIRFRLSWLAVQAAPAVSGERDCCRAGARVANFQGRASGELRLFATPSSTDGLRS